MTLKAYINFGSCPFPVGNSVHETCMDACVPCMIYAQVFPFHAWSVHGSSFHEACMVLPSMHDTCIKGTPDNVKNNFGSKNSKQLQGTAAAQIFSNFSEVCMEE